MKKIDTTKWQEFSMSELGFQNFHGSRLRMADRKDGNTPFITAGKEKQGVIGCVGNDVETYLNPITIDMFGNVFYHDGLFAGDDNVYFFTNDNLNRLQKIYIVSVIQATLGTAFAYVDQFRQDNVDELKILLPANERNQPNWQYMEDFMRNIETHVNTSLEVFQTITERKKQLLNTSQWKPFRMDALFEVVKGKRLTKSDMKAGNINYIGATAFNNGITAKVANNEYLHAAGTISVCYNGSIGQAFYQEEPYWATDDVNVLYPRFAMTKNVALFIIPILRNIGQRFAYVDKWTQDKMKETEIPLPSTSNGDPDFEYMEQYMKTIEQRVQNTITKIA